MPKAQSAKFIVTTSTGAILLALVTVLSGHVVWPGILPAKEDSIEKAWVMVNVRRDAFIEFPPVARLWNRLHPPPTPTDPGYSGDFGPP
jgi:hypothetical protein